MIMTPQELQRRFKESGYLDSQISILAQLNGCSTREIMKHLDLKKLVKKTVIEVPIHVKNKKIRECLLSGCSLRETYSKLKDIGVSEWRIAKVNNQLKEENPEYKKEYR